MLNPAPQRLINLFGSNMDKPCILLISGVDPQGCAGLTADIQTITTQGGHPVPLISCLTEQTRDGLTEMGALSKQQFLAQYQCCTADLTIAAIKIGLIPNLEIAQAIQSIVQELDVPVVLDPVQSSTSGGVEQDRQLCEFIKSELSPLVSLVTPNLPELQAMANLVINHYSDLEKAVAVLIAHTQTSYLIKGGHSSSEWAVDYFKTSDHDFYSYLPKLDKQVRGTGCILSSSIACFLAFGHDIRDAIILARAYLNKGVRLSSKIGCYRVFEHSSSPLELDDIPKLVYDYNLIGKQFNFPKCPTELGIYPVVDSSDWVEKLLAENIKTIQLRIKGISEQVKREEIAKVVSLSNESIACFINDYWQDAIAEHAYGVHLGQEDLHDANLDKIAQAGLRLGVSTHSYWELARALAINPSYIALGPVYETDSKVMPFKPQGLKRVAQWVQLLNGRYPLVAIGGIDIEKAKALKEIKVGSIAMISAITRAPDYRAATQALLTAWASPLPRQ